MAFDGRSAGAARVSGGWMLLRTRRVAYCGLTAPTTTNRTGAREVEGVDGVEAVEGVEGVEAVTVFTCPEVQHVEDMPTVTEPGARCMKDQKGFRATGAEVCAGEASSLPRISARQV